ncbi:hypothetical protein Bca101_078290 [Brassica carinata]
MWSTLSGAPHLEQVVFTRRPLFWRFSPDGSASEAIFQRKNLSLGESWFDQMSFFQSRESSEFPFAQGPDVGIVGSQDTWT